MDPEAFRGSSAGRLLRVGEGEAAYWSFLPHPLPPRIEWDVGLIQELSKADRSLGELAGLGRTIPNPHLLIHPFVRREAVLSSRIEGTQTDVAHLFAYEAVQMPLPGLEPVPSETDMREVLNYVHAMEYGLERVKTLPLSLRLIRELHARLMEGVRGAHSAPGEFRNTQNWIGRPGCSLSEAEYVPPPAHEMLSALDAFERYLHADDRCPPLVRLALIHYQFEAIHPFLDGNGRIGRLLISLLLVSWNLLPQPLLYLSAFFERNRQAYYDLLLNVSRRGAWRDWIVFFLRGVTEQAQDAIWRAKQLQDTQARWHNQLSTERAPALLLRLTDALFETPVLTIPEAQRLLGVTYRSAQLNIEKLVNAGILNPLNVRSRAQAFAAFEIVRILAEDVNQKGVGAEHRCGG